MKQEIPLEINDHLKIFGKDADEVDYNSVGLGHFCGSRIDEFNICACGGRIWGAINSFSTDFCRLI